MMDEKNTIQSTPGVHDALPEQVEKHAKVDSSSIVKEDQNKSGGMKSFFVCNVNVQQKL